LHRKPTMRGIAFTGWGVFCLRLACAKTLLSEFLNTTRIAVVGADSGREASQMDPKSNSKTGEVRQTSGVGVRTLLFIVVLTVLFYLLAQSMVSHHFF